MMSLTIGPKGGKARRIKSACVVSKDTMKVVKRANLALGPRNKWRAGQDWARLDKTRPAGMCCKAAAAEGGKIPFLAAAGSPAGHVCALKIATLNSPTELIKCIKCSSRKVFVQLSRLLP
jgi:hypothetical protein